MSKRAARNAQPWVPIVRGSDRGGIRDFLDGEPIHCGAWIEMQAGQTSVEVRYEIAERYRYFRDRVACKDCGGTGKPCGKLPLPDDDSKCGPAGTWGERYCLGRGCQDTCSHCDGTGDVSGLLIGPVAGRWDWIRAAVVHYSTEGIEFVRDVQSHDLFRWPNKRH